MGAVSPSITEPTRRNPMTDIDLSAQFDKISEKAKTAGDKLKEANQSTRDRLHTDAAEAHDRASAAAERLNDKAGDVKAKASSEWHGIRAKWQAHVSAAKANITDKQNRLDADI